MSYTAYSSQVSSYKTIVEEARVLHLYLYILCLLLRGLLWAIVCSKSDRRLGLFLSVWLVLQGFDSKGILDVVLDAHLDKSYLLLCVLPFRWVTMLCSLSNHFAHSIQ
jgi:hypothetical protein